MTRYALLLTFVLSAFTGVLLWLARQPLDNPLERYASFMPGQPYSQPGWQCYEWSAYPPPVYCARLGLPITAGVVAGAIHSLSVQFNRDDLPAVFQQMGRPARYLHNHYLRLYEYKVAWVYCYGYTTGGRFPATFFVVFR